MRIKNSIAYILASALIIAYLLILILGYQYSGDSEAYEFFFIDQKTNQYISEEDWKNIYCADKEEYLNQSETNENLGEG